MRQDGSSIWICGGSELASSLLTAGLVDEVIIKLNPILFGAGIPLFSNALRPTGLELLENHVYPSGHILLRYRVSG